MGFRLIAAAFAIAAAASTLSAQAAPKMPMGGMGGQPTSNLAAQPSGPLTITFDGKSAEWTPEKLAALPQATIKVYNAHLKAEQSYSGVPLMDLLAKLGVPDQPHGKNLDVYLVAEGSDGYKVVYSIGEVMPTLHDGTVIVADRVDGQPIKSAGPLQLVATGEKHPARWVRNLVAIRVRSAD